MISFLNITKIFKAELLTQPFIALNDVSFEIPSGSMVGFLGANGAGKTTSLKIIMDFIRPDSGIVKFTGELGTNKVEAFRNIGFLPERPYFYQNLTGTDFLHFMASLSEVPKKEAKSRMEYWAPRFRIDHALKRELRTYSKGMLQRIGFLATVIHDPKLIILDEPLSGLDPIGRKELKDVIVEIHKAGKTVFFSSHIVPDIEEICDRVIFLKEGELVYDGSVNQLIRSDKEMDYLIKFRTDKPLGVLGAYKSLERYPDALNVMMASESQKNILLPELVKAGIEISGVELIKPHLEEIFYKTKSNNDSDS